MTGVGRLGLARVQWPDLFEFRGFLPGLVSGHGWRGDIHLVGGLFVAAGGKGYQPDGDNKRHSQVCSENSHGYPFQKIPKKNATADEYVIRDGCEKKKKRNFP